MAILKFKTIKDSNPSELKSKLHELRLELMKLNSQRASKSVSNPGKIKEIRRSIAKILTAMNAKRQSAELGAGSEERRARGRGKKAEEKENGKGKGKKLAEKPLKSSDKKENNKKLTRY
ncbi:MAG TPA: 50S ribosomal protein L29 [Nanoarchaeota archaeon]|nr:MAG: 50S ribosomal protein L29, large subunit ribosomal protein L29 [archaeon GW2011_AR6]MBS3082800.1 50S ribosomal protein L29 [Candidatus Pacearchaeota archaeon]HIH18082.1 50S ribosomal protein L29 [Nanoarchaeota archaeon]HIH34226.1 50S ribosomal protein L29 [Nanoarchaeota archaeon]HIH50932.1 50S ribosomal protein L29 [Nanoarchaeota archaeon]